MSDEEYATKGDIRTLRDELHATRDELRQELHATRDGLRGEMRELREELRGEIRGVGVMVEQMRSDVRALAEAVSEKANKSDLISVNDNLSTRLSLLESVVRDNSRDLRANTEDVRVLRHEVAQLRLVLERRDVRNADLERRVAELEKRLGPK